MDRPINPPSSRYPTPALRWSLGLSLLLCCQGASLRAFDSGSDGSDGALDLTGTPPGTLVFDPGSFDPPLDPDEDNVYHFTSITVPADVTLVFEARRLNYSPIHWLATGAVQIDGTLYLRGDPGHPVGERYHAEPGPGGFHGGVGRRGDAVATRGFGPGGGSGGSLVSGGSHATLGRGNNVAPAYGNRFLLPLVGGSGGGGLRPFNNSPGAGGGGGGGAILIASSESIVLGGLITAAGGSGSTGGSGGAVRILAPVFSGTGTITVDGGGPSTLRGGSGWIRVEATERTFSGSLQGVTSLVTLAPRPVILSPPAPRVRITSVAGIPVPPSPTGSFEVPDAALDTGDPVTVEVETAHVPPGTEVTLLILREDTTDETVTTTPLVGTEASATASASVIFASGFSRLFVRATW